MGEKYFAEGEAAFISGGHPGNPFTALHISKNLFELDRGTVNVGTFCGENWELPDAPISAGKVELTPMTCTFPVA